MHQIDIGAARRDEDDAERQRQKIEGGERSVLAQDGGAGGTAPEPIATAKPATTPPMVMAGGGDRPAMR